MKITLYAIPISHPVWCARLMLEHKGLPYRRIDLLNGPHAAILRALGFPKGTAPALSIDGRKVQGTLDISRELERVAPEPALFPTDPTARAQVEEAERWAERELQPIPRMLAVPVFSRDRSTLPEFMADAHYPVPMPDWLIRSAATVPLVMIQRRRNQATDQAARQWLARLPAVLDRVELLLRQGVIGGDELNAADFQIGTSVRVLLAFDDLRPLIDDRPAAGHARRVMPDYAGHMPAVLPRDWLQPLRAPAPV